MSQKALLSFLCLLAFSYLSANCITPTSTNPSVLSFENGLDGFQNVAEMFPGYVGLDAARRSGPSPGNGPTTGTIGSGYLYIDFPPSTGNDQWAIELRSPCYDLSALSQPQLLLPLFRGAGGPFSIFLQVSTDGGLTWQYPPYYTTEYPQYQAPANREEGWIDLFADFSGFAGATDFSFRIGIAAAPNFDQELAIDGVRIGEAICVTPPATAAFSHITTGNDDGWIDLTASGGSGPLSFDWSNGATTEDITGLAPDYYSVTVTDTVGCYNTESIYVSDPLTCNGTKGGGYPYSYGFENNGLGLLRQNKDDDTNWKRRNTDTPTQFTGPQSWQPFPDGPQYRYIEAGNGNKAKTAVVTVKKCLNLTNLTEPVAQIGYHLYGNQQGTFAVELSGDGGTTWQRVFEESGQQGWWWKTATVDLSGVNTGQTRVRYVGRTGGQGPESDIAIDAFYIGEDTTTTQQSLVAPQTKALASQDDKVGTWFGGQPASVLVKGKSVEKTELAKATADDGSCSLCILEDDIFMPYPNPVTTGGTVTVKSLIPVDASIAGLLLTTRTALKISLLDDRSFQFDLPDLPAGVHHVRLVVGERVEILSILVL